MSLPSAAPRSAGLFSAFRNAWLPASSRDTSGLPVGRDPRLDMFRGIALVMIFINHVPGTIYENYTNRNFGFSDAAEAFVFMSGMAAGLAYSNGFRSGSLWSAIARVWARARQLYFVHLSITMICLAIFAAAALWFDLPEVLTRNNIAPLFSQPLSSLIGIPLLTHQLGYLNILPLYATLLLMTPVFMMVGLKRPWLMFALSIALWALAGQFRLNLPNFPTAGGWFFNPFSWQLLFVTGLLSGAAMKTGQRFIPYHPALFALAAALVIFILLWMKIPVVGDAGRDVLAHLADAGAPFYITWFDKSYLALPRLLHALALFYVLGHLPLMMTFAQSRLAAPLRAMGRQGLAVFATGTVLSMVMQVVKTPRQPDPLFDGVILGAGIMFLVGLAYVLNHTASLKSVQAAKPRA
ncbi:OpgC family protein [Devosia aurantiaca]|uniref:OpgC domain-containing protein n=1 Tax=Devosia aurantiaca TaxID=2714858 RepID=A0A6M1S9Z4_9HYPH|nr:OpgC domain-containing protein [Devosia aurantiaca]NGP16627.1 OpgC domain-containing protein [Devosia aurantiaca]